MRFWADRFSVRQVPKCAAANSTFIAITAKVLLLAATIQGNNCYPLWSLLLPKSDRGHITWS